MNLLKHVFDEVIPEYLGQEWKKSSIMGVSYLESSSLKVCDLEFSKITCLHFFPLLDFILRLFFRHYSQEVGPSSKGLFLDDQII